MNTYSSTSSSSQQARDHWFSELIATLSAHQVMLETNTANEEQKQFYETLFGGNLDQIALQGRDIAQKHFVSKILLDYIKILHTNHVMPGKLAFDLNDTEILVWAEVDDNNDDLEKRLILAEAEVNAKYHTFGYDMTSLIVEKGDKLPIPNHYSEFKYKA